MRSLRVPLMVLGFSAGSWVSIGPPHVGTQPVAHASGVVLPVADDPRPGIDPALVGDVGDYPQLNPTRSRSRAWLLAEGALPDPESGQRFITLTFDDGPSPERTPVILAALKKHNVRATFFFVGRNLEGDSNKATMARAVAKRTLDEGHLVGSHTLDHQNLATASEAEMLRQIDRGIDAVTRATGKRPSLFRPPFGMLDTFGERAIRERGLELVMWSIEAQDMQSRDTQAMLASLESQIEYAGGGIVLLHDIRQSSVELATGLLEWVYARRWDPVRPKRVGYTIIDLHDYFRKIAERPQPFEDRTALENARSAAFRQSHPRESLTQSFLDESH